MRIGIITYHFARNYGAVLQCYALQRYLSEAGHEVEVLDYVSCMQQRNNSLHHKREGLIANTALNVALLPFEAKRRRKERRFKEFLDEELCLSPRFDSREALASYIEQQGFDVVISGSDQVFNPRIDDFDEAFLLPFDTPCRKASFAASLGGSGVTELRAYADLLRAFDTLCVRESSATFVMEDVCGRRPLVADDPVFLLDADAWRQAISRWGVAKTGKLGSQGYVLGYYLKKEHSSLYLSYMHQVADTLGLPLQVVQVRLGVSAFGPEMIIDAGPKEFISLLSDASFVCTDSFHGTAFSLLLDVPFVSFEPTRSSQDSRKKGLLASLGQGHRSIYVDEIGEMGAVDVTALVDKPRCGQGIRQMQCRQRRVLGEVVEGRPCQ